MKKTITAHTIVKNDANFVWFALNSVVDFMDKIIIWDTGSTDGTWEIVKEFEKLHPKKTITKKHAASNFDEQKVRGEMLDITRTDWFMVLDGDEIWWESSIKKVLQEIAKNGEKIESIVIPTINLVGDIYHYQEPQAGNYHLAGKTGHYNLRFINRKIPGLASLGEHGVWGWVDEEQKMIQDRGPERVIFVDAPYLHATHLQRSPQRILDAAVSKRVHKLKYELGITFPSDYYYPESLFKPRPSSVPSAWKKLDTDFFIRAFIETPLRKLKRRYLPKKVGY